MSDNFFGSTFGPSTPGALNLVSGQTHGATPPTNISDNVANGSVIVDARPTYRHDRVRARLSLAAAQRLHQRPDEPGRGGRTSRPLHDRRRPRSARRRRVSAAVFRPAGDPRRILVQPGSFGSLRADRRERPARRAAGRDALDRTRSLALHTRHDGGRPLTGRPERCRRSLGAVDRGVDLGDHPFLAVSTTLYRRPLVAQAFRPARPPGSPEGLRYSVTTRNAEPAESAEQSLYRSLRALRALRSIAVGLRSVRL